jgi:hypothetical protein
VPSRTATVAALSLVLFAVLTGLALAAWFASVPEPWSWKAIIAVLCAALALISAVLVWRAPNRTHALLGAGVLALSLVRVGSPSEWNWASWTLLMLTGLLMVPLIHAAIVLKPPPEG